MLQATVRSFAIETPQTERSEAAFSLSTNVSSMILKLSEGSTDFPLALFLSGHADLKISATRFARANLLYRPFVNEH